MVTSTHPEASRHDVLLCFCTDFFQIWSEYERISCYIFDLEHQGYAVFVLVKDQEPEWVLAE